MMRSLFSGVSGLKNHQTRMDVIGNNISNVNTTGFKSSRTTFVDMLSQTLTGASAPQDNRGGTNAKQIGLGSSVSSIDMLFTNGSVQSTGKNTDLCMSGNGLFVVNNGTQNYYTRNGAFEFDAAGNYVIPGNGYFVQGWMADGTGPKAKIDPTKEPGNIVIPAGKPMDSAATTEIDLSKNIDADTAAGATGATMTVTLVDSLGGTHDVTLTLTKDATTPNLWSGAVTSTDPTINTPTVGTAIKLEFETNGALKSIEGDFTVQPATAGEFDDITVNITGTAGSLTQYSGMNTIMGTPDGNTAGTLESVSIDNSGTITGTYTNGVRQIEAQVAVAQFNNAAGLNKIGDSLYQTSNNSGEPNVKTATDFGVTITPSALEMSNVDVANEFTDMIITQRGFQSNSKIITTSDEMLETLINLKR